MSASARFETALAKMVQLDRKAEARQVISVDDVKDPEKLARILNELRAGVDERRRRFDPRVIDFAGKSVSASTTYRFEHGFGGKVVWWVVDWKPTSTAANQYAEFFRVDGSAGTTDDVLVLLTSGVTAGVVTIRIAEAG